MLETLKYLLYGNNLWGTRMEATQNDWFLFTYVSTGVSVLVLNYIVYLIVTLRSGNKGSLSYKHRMHVARILLISGIIHTLTYIIGWFIPLFYIVGTLFWTNAYLTFRLNKSKLVVYAIDESEEGIAARQALIDIKNRIMGVAEEDAEQKLRDVVKKLEEFLDVHRKRLG